MKTAVVYLMSGPAHLANLVVSIKSLRRHWTGPVLVVSWDESSRIVTTISEDRSLEIRHLIRRPGYRGKNSQFFHKIQLMQELTMYDKVMYLDADTMPIGDVNELFEQAEDYEFLATQFNHWETGCDGVVDKRIRRLRDYPIPAEIIDEVTYNVWPSVNGGVFVTDPNSEILRRWEEWTDHAKESVFIADEAVLHVVMAKYFERGFGVAVGGMWNASPKYSQIPDRDVKIWHFHGDSNLRPNKSPKGVKLWLSEYLHCLEYNVGGICDWKDRIGCDYLTKLHQTPVDCCMYCGQKLALSHSSNCPDNHEINIPA